MAEATALTPIIGDLISRFGSISIAQYIALALGHPQHGYYTTREPFGANGDFTTAPEISQLFGEMIGLWAMSSWQGLGNPIAFNLVELGPGRGTLMRDVMRSFTAIPGLADKTAIHLVEFSPRLKDIQSKTLTGFDVTWHETIDTLPEQVSIIVANEFFDALPINQAIFHQGQWHERIIIQDEEELLFGIGKPLKGIHVPQAKDGVIYEYAPLASDIMDKICALLKQNKGAFLIADYGDNTPLDARIGETLQAIYRQQPAPALSHPGEADLTAHVAFSALRQQADSMELITTFKTQREFLTAHGIRLRAEHLLVRATNEQAKAVGAGLHRLIDPSQMGDLFKILTVMAP